MCFIFLFPLLSNANRNLGNSLSKLRTCNLCTYRLCIITQHNEETFIFWCNTLCTCLCDTAEAWLNNPSEQLNDTTRTTPLSAYTRMAQWSSQCMDGSMIQPMYGWLNDSSYAWMAQRFILCLDGLISRPMHRWLNYPPYAWMVHCLANRFSSFYRVPDNIG